MSINVRNIKLGDTVVIAFGFENTEHQVLNVVGEMVKIAPRHICMGHWTDSEYIKAVVTTSNETPEDTPTSEKKTGFFSRLFS